MLTPRQEVEFEKLIINWLKKEDLVSFDILIEKNAGEKISFDMSEIKSREELESENWYLEGEVESLKDEIRDLENINERLDIDFDEANRYIARLEYIIEDLKRVVSEIEEDKEKIIAEYEQKLKLALDKSKKD